MIYLENVGGVIRRLVVEGDRDGSARTSFTVGDRNRTLLGRGRSDELDEAGRAWLAERLPFILRVTGWQAEERVGRILARSGVDGLFDEIRSIPSDHVARVYLTAALEQAELDHEQLRRWVKLAGAVIESDFELAETLSRVPAEALGDPVIQQAFVDATGNIDSDFELRRTLATLLAQGVLAPAVLDSILEAALSIGSDFEAAELVIELLDRYPAGRAIPDTFFELAAGIGSDFELRRSLDAFLRRDDLAGRDPEGWADQLDAVLASAAGIGSDFEAAELLIATARRYPVGRPLPEVYFDLAEHVGSDFELRRALAAALERDLAPDGLVRLLRAARGIGSDFELAELLLRVRQRHHLEGEARQAFDDAVATLSGSERRRVEGRAR